MSRSATWRACGRCGCRVESEREIAGMVPAKKLSEGWNFESGEDRRSALRGRFHDRVHVGVETKKLQHDRMQRPLRNQKIVDREIMNARRQKAVHRLTRGFDDRLPLHIEGCVDENGNAGE